MGAQTARARRHLSINREGEARKETMNGYNSLVRACAEVYPQFYKTMSNQTTKPQRSQTKPVPFRYKPEWCKQKDCEFHSYPQDGQCVCGVWKHHVHCQHGNIIQIG